MGSRSAYARFAAADAPGKDRLCASEREFIAACDSFYIATVNEVALPYVQCRGVRAEFFKVLDDDCMGFADCSGNRQYVDGGQLGRDDRVSLVLIDYRNWRRLKVLSHTSVVDASDPSMLQHLSDH